MLRKVKRFIKDIINVFSFVFARKFIKKIQRFNPDEHLFLFSKRGIGDLCYCCAFLKEIKNKYPKKIVLIVCDNHSVSILKYFGDYIDEIVLIEKKAHERVLLGLACYKNYLRKRVKNKMDFFVACGWGLVDLRARYNNIEICRDIVFNLDEDVDLLFPDVPKIESQVLIEKYGIIPQRTIIINPYTNSNPKNRPVIYERIVEYYTSKGFKVFSNLAPGQEAIKGTTPLYCNLEELYNLAPLCGYFIGTRSGVMDFLIATKTTIIAHYFQWNGCRLYSLKAWAVNDKTYDYDGTDEEFLPFVQSIIGE